MDPQIIAALVAAGATVGGGLITAIAPKIPRLLKKKKALRLHGGAIILRRVTGGELEGYSVAQINRTYPQVIDDCSLTLTDVRATIDATIHIDDQSGRAVSGRLTGSGVFEKGTVLLQYEVEQKDGQSWAGVMSLSIPGMGPIWGYFLTNSFSHPGHVNLGRIALGPVSQQRPNILSRQHEPGTDKVPDNTLPRRP